MAPKYDALSLTTDRPVDPFEKPEGYFRNTDPTELPVNSLTYPSINCFIPNKDKVVPRLGSTLLGREATSAKNWPIIGHKERFATMGGSIVEVRVIQSDDANLQDIIEVLYPDPVTGDLTWYQITQNVNPLLPGVGKLGMRARYYMDDWFDTNLNPANSLRLPRLIWVNGNAGIYSWTGGIANIIGVSGTTLTIDSNTTWASLGFVDPANGGSGNIIVNGVIYIILSGWSTNILTLASTSGISINDVAFAQIEYDATTIPFDVCRQNKNYMFYGNWNSRQLYMANNFNRPAEQTITNSDAVLNDLVVDNSNYTGTGQHVYRVTIDSVNPEQDTQSFNGGGLNDIAWNTSSYSGTAGVTNTYKISIVGDTTMFINTVSGSFTAGQVIQGGTSNAEAVIVQTFTLGGIAGLGLRMLSTKAFEAAEAILNITDGTSTANIAGVAAQNWYTGTKNGVAFTTGGTYGTLANNAIFSNGPITLPDGITIRFANFDGHFIGDTFTLVFNQGGADTFQYQIDGATPVATGVAITGSAQSLGSGLSITFKNTTGHTLGDFWDITVYQAITEAWHNFYYDLPVRRPGQGYIYQLPSNFWTMAPQESEMYVNSSYGYWSYVQTVLSADLQSETVSLTPLKQPSSSKVIFPYMLDYLDDTLIYVTTNKQLDMIGRKEFLQLPQTSNLSQPIAHDFAELGFENGSMKYYDKTLWITSPEEGYMLAFDNHPNNKYWQPPQVIPENGILSIVNNTLITHSPQRDQTLNLFTGQNGDNEADYTVKIYTSYNSYGDRWRKKNSSMSFIEGYVTGIPPLVAVVILGVNGCSGSYPHLIKPVPCIPDNHAPFGEGAFGSHPFGSDIFMVDPHFNEIYKQYDPIMEFYFAALGLQCTTASHTYSLLSLGLNVIYSDKGNNQFTNEEIISRI